MDFGREIGIAGVLLYFLPVKTRIPLRFGGQETREVDCARVRMTVRASRGGQAGNLAGCRTGAMSDSPATGWGECPLSVAWAWPSREPAAIRRRVLREFCVALAKSWESFGGTGSALGLGRRFMEEVLPELFSSFNAALRVAGTCGASRKTLRDAASVHGDGESFPVSGAEREAVAMPWSAALMCAAAFDIALHDAYGTLMGKPSLSLLVPGALEHDLAGFFKEGSGSPYAGRYPADFLCEPTAIPGIHPAIGHDSSHAGLVAWHLVGIDDPLDERDPVPEGGTPLDGYPVYLRDWIQRDGLECLKIKLRGVNAGDDFARVSRVGKVARDGAVRNLSVDFNGCAEDPATVLELLDRLEADDPETLRMLAFIEEPFSASQAGEGRGSADARALAARVPLVMDESAMHWMDVDIGRERGWSGVALKTCKTLTGAILALCRAKGSGMSVMAQDLTNPMLAQIAHVNFASRTGCPLGFESNSMQFYPDASLPEAAVHPGVYRRRRGRISVDSLGATGMGYRIDEIARVLPEPAYGDR